MAAAAPKFRVAVCLSGCGVYDGSEITESVSAAVHLSRAGAEISYFAPDKEQKHVVDHRTGEEQDGPRNVLAESARIARGKIADLATLSAGDFDALVLPGGFGAAKNLSTYADDGAGCKADPDVRAALEAFRKAGKPIGLCCISPVLAARVFGKGVTVTTGSESERDGRWPYAGTHADIVEMGATHVETDIDGVYVDERARVVTAPAYMCNCEPHEVYDSVGKMIAAVLDLVRPPSSA